MEKKKEENIDLIKYLSSLGYAKNKAKTYVRLGFVKVNGKEINKLPYLLKENDIVKIEKKEEKLDAEISEKAIELATESIIRADKYRQIELVKREQKIKDRATDLVEQYKGQMDEVTYNGAKTEIKMAKVDADFENKKNEG